MSKRLWVSNPMEHEWALNDSGSVDVTSGNPKSLMFPRQPNCDGGWTIDVAYLEKIRDALADDDETGKASLETIEEILLVLADQAPEAVKVEGPQVGDVVAFCNTDDSGKPIEIVDIIIATAGTAKAWHIDSEGMVVLMRRAEVERRIQEGR